MAFQIFLNLLLSAFSRHLAQEDYADSKALVVQVVEVVLFLEPLVLAENDAT